MACAQLSRDFHRARLGTVELVAILLMLGRWCYISLFEQYYYNRFGSDVLQRTSFDFPNGSFCVSSELIDNYTGKTDSYKVVESQSNHLVAYGQVANTIPAVIATVILGPLTDKYGRRLGMALPAAGLVMQGGLSVAIVHWSLDPRYFILANFLGGMFGSAMCVLASCFSYIADVTSAKWRSLRIGILLSLHSLAGSLGTFLGGYWLYKIHCNFLPPMCLFVVCNALILVYSLFLMPESLSRAERDKLVRESPGMFGSYKKGFKLFLGGLPLLSTWKLYATLLAANIELFNFYGSLIIDVYFLKALPFDFGPLKVSIYQTVKAGADGAMIFLFIVVLAALKVGDAWIMLIAVGAHSLSNLLLGFATQDWHLYAIAAFKGIEGLTWTGGRALMSKLVNPELQGSLFSIIAATQSTTILTASAAWPFIFPLTLQHNMRSGMTYIFMAILGFLALPLIMSLFLSKKSSETAHVTQEGDEVTPSDGSDQPLLKDSDTKNKSYS